MYQALYRKYRPTTLDEVTGQEIVIKTLKNAIVNNKISHAYLFTGPRGTGKTSIAKILAKTVNCNNLNGYLPCNKCVNCTQINNKQNTDVIEIDAASNNGVDEIREIRNKVNLVPSTGKYKIYIIDEVHMLTTGAFNALLKTLEEPPSHIIFILATTEPHKIPATILSRCQRFDFKKIPINGIYNRLKYIVEQEQISIADDALLEIARLSDGGMRDSIGLLDQTFAYSPNNITIEDVHEINGSLPASKLCNFIELLNKKDIFNLLKMIDDFNSSGKSIIKISEELLNYLKNILLYKISPMYFKIIITNEEDYKELSEKMSRNEIIKLLNKLNNSINDIKISNDPKLAMEILIIKECSEDNKDNNYIINKEQIAKKDDIKDKTNESIEFDNNIVVNENNNIKENNNEILEQNNDIEKNINNSNNNENLSQEPENNHVQLFISNDKLEEFKKIRIDNTLSKFNKQTLLDLRSKIHYIDDYLLDDEYSSIASFLLDGEIKAASDEYIVFIFKTTNIANDFNNNIIKIQEFLSKIFDYEYKIIATDNISWEIIKDEFNNKKRSFNYIKEEKSLEQMFNNNIKDEVAELDNIFGSIVEYE